MKERLDQLTIAQFVDLLCGDSSVLTGKAKVSPGRIAAATNRIVFEYRQIADPASTISYLSDAEELSKEKINLSIFEMCSAAVCDRHAVEKVRAILVLCGLDVDRMSDRRLEVEIKSRTERSRLAIAKLEDNFKNEGMQSDIRKDFDMLTASMMAHFKFQIDMLTINASLYAYLVARQSQEIKAQISALKNK